MPERKITYSIIFSLFVIFLVLAGMIAQTESKNLKVIFLNVGQGDATLIEQGDKQILIDGGPDGKVVMEELGKYIPFWDREIEAVIATHPDADHITGLISVMENYKVDAVIDNAARSDSQAYQKYLNIIKQKDIPRLRGKSGMNLRLDAAKLAVLYPCDSLENNPNDTNADSIVAKLETGKNSFLLTGDFPTEKDQALLSAGFDLRADVLKVSHHGSKAATSQTFLDAVKPTEAVISVGQGNCYGHPTAEVLDRLRADRIKILRTDERGDVEYDM